MVKKQFECYFQFVAKFHTFQNPISIMFSHTEHHIRTNYLPLSIYRYYLLVKHIMKNILNLAITIFFDLLLKLLQKYLLCTFAILYCMENHGIST